ncbi:SusF/SusE family outer membrane protein [Pontibacter beigongshangensis]|uniref:SusF/SusE family outer membrane protein n=1 Tax=Pontibacter beigongshangensis TaxID=2574733 RepID=UPI00164F2266|nr:SusF/SusE family outer membrane protein [Pontibacter beigongshangensis]
MKHVLNNTTKAPWYVGALLLLVSVFASSCEKDIYEEFDMALNKPLELSTSKEEVVLQEALAASEAIAFSWTSGSNYGTSSGITYKLYLDKQGNNFQDAVMVDMGRSSFEKKYSMQELNSLLLSQVNLVPGVEAAVEAKVVTKVLGTDYSDSTTTVIRVTPYQPVTTTLFLIGDATPNSWSTDNATPMTLSSAGPGRFTWQGRLNEGEFKFITTLGSFLPSYNKGASDSQLVLRTSDSEPDEKFRIEQSGVYSISVNLLDHTISITEGAGPAYSELWIVGDATPKGWDLDNADEMTQSDSDPFVFTYLDYLNAGELKIATAKDWGTPFYRPTVENAPITSTAVQLSAGEPDNKWRIAQAGVYKITLNLQTMTIVFAPVDVYMIGDAGPNGWDIAVPEPMSKSGSVYTYTGPLQAGEFKFSLFKGDWCDGLWINAAAENQPITNTNFVFRSGCEGADNKWRVTGATAGNYIVSVDLAAKSVSIVRQ